MGIGAPTVDQTVVILANNSNRKGLTFRITNASTTDNKMIVQPSASGVTIDFDPIGNEILAGTSAAFIAINDNNSFLRYESSTSDAFIAIIYIYIFKNTLKYN